MKKLQSKFKTGDEVLVIKGFLVVVSDFLHSRVEGATIKAILEEEYPVENEYGTSDATYKKIKLVLSNGVVVEEKDVVPYNRLTLNVLERIERLETKRWWKI